MPASVHLTQNQPVTYSREGPANYERRSSRVPAASAVKRKVPVLCACPASGYGGPRLLIRCSQRRKSHTFRAPGGARGSPRFLEYTEILKPQLMITGVIVLTLWEESFGHELTDSVFQISRNGEGEKKLTGIGVINPIWSDDGQHVLHFQHDSNDHRKITLNTVTLEGDVVSRIPLPDTLSFTGGMSLHPNGDTVAFSAGKDWAGEFDIYIMPLDGTPPELLVKDGIFPAWAPDGNRLGFATNRDGNLEIYLANFMAATLTNLTNHENHDSRCSWSPDGAQIVFQSDRNGNKDIYLLEIKTGHLIRLTENPANDKNPAWSPVGDEIIFSSDRDDQYGVYSTTKSDYLTPIFLFPLNHGDWGLSWSPFGDRICYLSERSASFFDEFVRWYNSF